MAHPGLKCLHLGIQFGGLLAVEDFNLEIGESELVGLRFLQPHQRRTFAANHLGSGLSAVLPTIVAVQFAVEPDIE